MKVIVSNHKRSAVYNQEISLNGLQKFIENEFPRTQEVKMKFIDLKGQEVKISSDEDVNLLKKMYNGQNFVQVKIEGKHKGHGHKHGHGHGHKHHHQFVKSPEKQMNRKEKRTNILAKVYGGQPKQYEAFVQENDDLKMGKLIKAFAEKNGGFEKIMQKDKGQRKMKNLSKAFGGEPSQYADFYKANQDLKLFQLVQKYSKETGIEPKDNKKGQNEERIQKKIQRLSVALGNPHQVYEEAQILVRENPKLNVKQILEKLQNEGRNVDFEKFRQLRRKEEKQRKERFGSLSKQISSEKEQKFEELTPGQFKIESKPLSQEKTNKKQLESREKGRILMEMKEIFGNERSAEYFKFINENFQEGEAAIIEKWIQTYEI